MDVGKESAAGDRQCAGVALNRREFVGRSGKALYLAPTLTVLGSMPAAAQFGSPPPPPGGAAPAAPEPPAPAE